MNAPGCIIVCSTCGLHSWAEDGHNCGIAVRELRENHSKRFWAQAEEIGRLRTALSVIHHLAMPPEDGEAVPSTEGAQIELATARLSGIRRQCVKARATVPNGTGTEE